MAFSLAGSLSPFGGPLLRSEIIANSITTTATASVTVDVGGGGVGFVILGVPGRLVFGHLRAHVTNNGVGLLTDGSAGAAIGSYVDTYVTSSTNQTVAQVRAQVDVSKETLYSADPDVAISTTTGSDLLGYRTDIINSLQTDEDAVTSASAQYFIWGSDPNDSGNQIVSVYESGVFGL